MISRDYAKMLGKYEWQYKRAGKAEDSGSSWGITWPLVVAGPPGTGKTIAMSQYLDSVKTGPMVTRNTMSTVRNSWNAISSSVRKL